MPLRRLILGLLLTLAVVPAHMSSRAAAGEAEWTALRQGGVVALFRHARAPGTGDPAGFRLADCATQRNLSEQGRAEARRIGDMFRTRGVRVETVLNSRWCRARDTARLAFGDLARDEPFLDSFFGDRRDEPAQTAALRAFVSGWASRSGVAVLVTHQVNITALTGIVPTEGEAVLLRPEAQGFSVFGRLRP